MLAIKRLITQRQITTLICSQGTRQANEAIMSYDEGHFYHEFEDPYYNKGNILNYR